MVFNPNSRESCEYYGVPYKEERLIGRPSASSHDYYPNQSRDYALSNTVHCECRVCPINKNGYCEMPSAIRIGANGVCKTGISFVNPEPTPQRKEPKWDTEKDEFTPVWFWSNWKCNCPVLTPAELEAYQKEVPISDMMESWNDDVIRVNKRKRK